MKEIALTTEMTPKIDTGGVAFSLRSRDYKDAQCVVTKEEPVFFEHNQTDARVKVSSVCQTLTGRMGTGGGHLPMVMENQNKGGDRMNEVSAVVRRLTPL